MIKDHFKTWASFVPPKLPADVMVHVENAFYAGAGAGLSEHSKIVAENGGNSFAGYLVIQNEIMEHATTTARRMMEAANDGEEKGS